VLYVNHGAQPTILIADGEPAQADRYASLLEGFDVRTASGSEAALLALGSTVDVVLFDREMPGLSCGDVIDRISEVGADCRVVVLTAVEPSVDVVEKGFDEYLVKPVSGERLRETVERVHQRSAYDAKLQEYFSLASKRATLETRHELAELRTEPKYQRLCERLRSVRDRLDDVLADLPAEDGYFVAIEERPSGRPDQCAD
jgi:DNA-binding response OmpR family regulator